MNSEVILLYWDIGQAIVEKQQALGRGESVVELVASDLRGEFPGATGFSARNVWDRLESSAAVRHSLDALLSAGK